MRVEVIARRTAMLAFAMAVALSVATLAHAQASGKAMGPQPCSWYTGGIPGIRPSPERIIVAPAVEAAALIRRVEPEYPADPQVRGTLVLCAIIAKDGTVEALQYVSGPSPLIKTALHAVSRWRYKRTLLNGKPVEVETRIFVEFKSKRPMPKKGSGSESGSAAPPN